MMDFGLRLTVPDIMTDFPGMPRAPAALVVRLHEARGRIVEYGDLQTAIEAVTGNRSTVRNVSSTAKHARKHLGGRGEIIAAYGVGYHIKWAL